jgi:hypothetical protein
MATITFYGNVLNGTPDLINHQAGSGIGFFGSQAFAPVPIGETQSTTWITTSNGTAIGHQLNNCQYPINTANETTTVKLNGANAINLANLPNYLATLNIRFEHTTAVRTSQPRIIIFNRSSVNNHAVGVTTFVYEVRHPLTNQAATNLSHRASNTNVWTEFDPTVGGIPTPMALTNSPGPSGLNTTALDITGEYQTYLTTTLGLTATDYNEGGTGEFLRHDWYVALSSSPNDIGEKTQYGLYFTVDYL